MNLISIRGFICVLLQVFFCTSCRIPVMQRPEKTPGPAAGSTQPSSQATITRDRLSSDRGKANQLKDELEQHEHELQFRFLVAEAKRARKKGDLQASEKAYLAAFNEARALTRPGAFPASAAHLLGVFYEKAKPDSVKAKYYYRAGMAFATMYLGAGSSEEAHLLKHLNDLQKGRALACDPAIPDRNETLQASAGMLGTDNEQPDAREVSTRTGEDK